VDLSSARWISGAHVTSYHQWWLYSVAGRLRTKKYSRNKRLPANMAKVSGRGGMSGFTPQFWIGLTADR
jgi:hypothetical protein